MYKCIAESVEDKNWNPFDKNLGMPLLLTRNPADIYNYITQLKNSLIRNM